MIGSPLSTSVHATGWPVSSKPRQWPCSWIESSERGTVDDAGREGGEEAMRPFEACCKDLHDAMNQPPNSMFRVEENGVLYLAVGYEVTEDGPAWFDQAVLFCPFCGTGVQTREEVSSRVRPS